MALHADFHLTVLRETCGIDDRAAHTLDRSSLSGDPSPSDFDVVLTGAVTTLAVDPFRQPIRKARAFLLCIHLGLDLNKSAVAGHTAIADFAAEAGVIGPVVAGTHRPVTAVLRVPGDGKLYQFSRFRT